MSIDTWVFKYRIKRGFNIIVSKLPQVFMSDSSINRTYKQEVNFVFQTPGQKEHDFVAFSGWKRLFTPSSFMPSRSLIRVSLNFVIVMSLRYVSAWRTDLNKRYLANLSLFDIFVLHSSLKRIIFLPDGRKKGSLRLVPRRPGNHKTRDILLCYPPSYFSYLYFPYLDCFGA